MSKASPTGRPKKNIDEEFVRTLARQLCPNTEIAACVGCDEGTIRGRFSEVVRKAREEGKAIIRRLQWDSARGGNTAMLIWLGKQYLGQADKAEVKTAFGDLYSDDPVKIANDLRRRGKTLTRAIRRGENGNGNGNGNGHS